MFSLIARTRLNHVALFLTTIALLAMAAAWAPTLVVGQDSPDDCPEGFERIDGAKECTPIEWDGPVVDPGILQTPGLDLPPPVLVLPTTVPPPPDPVTTRADETPAAPTVAPRAFGSLTIDVLTCPRWFMEDYTNGLIPPCGPLPGISFSVFSEGEPIAAGASRGSKDERAPARVTFAEVPAGKLLIEQKPAAGYESVRVFCGEGQKPIPLVGESSVVVELQPGEDLTCSFVNVTAK